MKRLLSTGLVVGVLAVALWIRSGTLVTGPAVDSALATQTHASSGLSAGGEAGADRRLSECGAGLPRQNPLVGSFELENPADIYGHIPHLPQLPDLGTFAPPVFVVLFDRGIFVFPVPLMGTSETASYYSQPHTIVCIYHDGRPDYYADVNFTGWTP